MRVSELANRLGVTPDTVRFYTRVGYLSPNKRQDNGYKEYDTDDVQRLRFILSARHLGFSVEDVGVILSEADHGKCPCPTTRRLMEKRLEETERRFQEMAALRESMKMALAEWQTISDQQPSEKTICHLIEAFEEHRSQESQS